MINPMKRFKADVSSTLGKVTYLTITTHIVNTTTTKFWLFSNHAYIWAMVPTALTLHVP
jgi:hypothetical protein